MVEAYLTSWLAFIKKHNLLHRAFDLHLMAPLLPLSEAQARYDTLDRLRVRGMREAEKKCRKLRMGKHFYSPGYSRAGATVMAWAAILARASGRKVDRKYFQWMRRFV